MKKIKTVFQRNYDTINRLVRNEVTPGCEWVLDGEGVATRKFDGTCCMVKNGVLYKRYDCKNGKTPPEGFIPAQEPDPLTGHWPGWVLVDKNNKSDKWFVKSYDIYNDLKDGTYELIGIHFQGNPEYIPEEYGDIFVKHGDLVLTGVPRDFEGIKKYLYNNYMEGIVFHRGNGDMAKIKRTDFGFEWNGSKSKRRGQYE